MTLVLLALALAAQLLLESQRTFVMVGREARDPLVGYAVAQLKSDVRRSAAVAGGPQVLVLGSHPSGTVRWERQGNTLTRTVTGADGEAKRRTVLRGLTAWGWSSSRLPGGSDLVTIALGYRRHQGVPWVTAPRLGPDVLEEEQVLLTLSPRGAIREDRW